MASRVGDSEGARRLAKALADGSSRMSAASHSYDQAVAHSSSAGMFHVAENVAALMFSIRVKSLNDRVDRMWRVVKHHEYWVEATERELRNLEWRIRNWMSAHPPSSDPTDLSPDASIVGYLPPSLSFEWRDVHARLKAHGVWV